MTWEVGFGDVGAQKFGQVAFLRVQHLGESALLSPWLTAEMFMGIFISLD